MGITCGGLNAYCIQTRPLFLRTSGSSGVPKALFLERNGQLSCNPKKKKRVSQVQAQHEKKKNATNSHITNVLAKAMAQVMSQTSALPARASPPCRSEQCGLMPKCDCGTTNAEMCP